jgi:hypothetical protein
MGIKGILAILANLPETWGDSEVDGECKEAENWIGGNA